MNICTRNMCSRAPVPLFNEGDAMSAPHVDFPSNAIMIPSRKKSPGPRAGRKTRLTYRSDGLRTVKLSTLHRTAIYSPRS